MGTSTGNAGPVLRRTLGLAAITAFGVGDILGAGVYGLVGKIAGLVGCAAWMSYVLAGFMAILTGLTYAEWTSRHPRAGGAAHFCDEAYRCTLITFLVICFVTLSGLFSMATASRVFADYALAHFSNPPEWLRQTVFPIIFILVMAGVAMRGIHLSSSANMVCTAIEVSGLLVIIALGLRFLGRVDYLAFAATASAPPTFAANALSVASGAALAFFAFVGFEDLANLSEETIHPERTVPLGICLSILITGIIYGAIALVAVSVVPPTELSASRSPLVDVVRSAAPGFPTWIYSFIPAFAVFNTGLLNLMMASRLLYGMARSESRLLPSALAILHPRWHTPMVGVAVSAAIVAVVLLSFRDVGALASGTSSFLLIVFILLHIGLIRIKRRENIQPRFRVPVAVPVAGVLAGLLLLSRQNVQALKAAANLTAVALVLYLALRLLRGKGAVADIEREVPGI